MFALEKGIDLVSITDIVVSSCGAQFPTVVDAFLSTQTIGKGQDDDSRGAASLKRNPVISTIPEMHDRPLASLSSPFYSGRIAALPRDGKWHRSCRDCSNMRANGRGSPGKFFDQILTAQDTAALQYGRLAAGISPRLADEGVQLLST
jgi:hypothetical protein